MTTVSTHSPARTDVVTGGAAPRTDRRMRGWTSAGVGAGLAGIATIVTSSAVNAVYDPDLVGNTPGIASKLADQAPMMFAFHSVTVVGAACMVVFAAGLFRRLRATTAETSTAALVAFSGLLGTAVVSVLGSGLDTEFMMTLASEPDAIDPVNAAMYNHWIGTIPWVWVLAGLSGLAVHAVSRAGGVPRWIGRVGLVLGGLTLVLGISPLEYMAAVTGALWLLVTAIGFRVGDRAFRAGR